MVSELVVLRLFVFVCVLNLTDNGVLANSPVADRLPICFGNCLNKFKYAFILHPKHYHTRNSLQIQIAHCYIICVIHDDDDEEGVLFPQAVRWNRFRVPRHSCRPRPLS